MNRDGSLEGQVCLTRRVDLDQGLDLAPQRPGVLAVDVSSPFDDSLAPARLYVTVDNDNDDGLRFTFTDDAP